MRVRGEIIMVSTIASLSILVGANVAPAMKAMDEVGGKVKDVGETSQKEGKKTEGFMKRWGASFAVIGAAATGALYAVVKASPLLAGAMKEAQDALSLLFMTIGDALEPVIRPFVDLLWKISEIVLDMPGSLGTLTASALVLGPALVGVAVAIKAIGTSIVLFGVPLATLLAGFGAIIFAAGLVAVALYYITGDPTTAIIGAFTTIGIGAGILMHHPLIAAVSGVIGGFALIVGAGDDMEIAIGLAFVGVGMAATALMSHPALAAVGGIAALLLAWGKASEDARRMIEIATVGIIAALSLLMHHPVIAAVAAATAGVLALIAAYKELRSIFERMAGAPWEQEFASEYLGRKLLPGERMFQYGGYVPYTGPAMLHAGEYVTPAGRAGGAGMGPTDNRVINNYFDIHDMTLAGEMDVERLKQKLDELYKREMERVA